MSDEPPEMCPICGREDMRRAKKLYGLTVCKKCAHGLASHRQAAYVLDWVVVGFGVMVTGMVTAVLMPEALGSDNGAAVAIAPFIPLTLFVLLVGLFLGRDGLSGRSPAKRMLDLQVVDAKTHAPIGFWRSVLRNVILVIPFMVLFEGVFLVRGQRVGDLIARTIVIRPSRAERFKGPAAESSELRQAA